MRPSPPTSKPLTSSRLLLYMNHRFRVHEADEEGDFPTLPNAVPNEALWYSPDRKFA